MLPARGLRTPLGLGQCRSGRAPSEASRSAGGMWHRDRLRSLVCLRPKPPHQDAPRSHLMHPGGGLDLTRRRIDLVAARHSSAAAGPFGQWQACANEVPGRCRTAYTRPGTRDGASAYPRLSTAPTDPISEPRPRSRTYLARDAPAPQGHDSACGARYPGPRGEDGGPPLNLSQGETGVEGTTILFEGRAGAVPLPAGSRAPLESEARLATSRPNRLRASKGGPGLQFLSATDAKQLSARASLLLEGRPRAPHSPGRGEGRCAALPGG